MATRRLRPEDWTPLPQKQTRIQIRAREPREGNPNQDHKPSRPRPINFPEGQSPPQIPRNSVDSPQEPEVVDFAPPPTDQWSRRAGYAAYQQQRPGGQHVAYQQRRHMARPVAPSPSSVYSERQSEMSFGILDYYAREASPPPTPKLDLVPRIGTPVTDPGLGKFDFGLGLGLRGLVKEKPADKEASRDGLRAVENLVTDALAGAQKEGPLSPERSSPPGMPAKKTPNSEPPPAKKTYSLFPKDSTPPSRPSITLASERDSSPPHQRISMVPSHQQPDPSYRPRKESVTSSLRSRKDSFTSYRPPPQTQRIPLRILSAGSSTYSYATPRSSAATTNRPSISPPDSAASRWSEDTITSPTTAVAPGGGPRTSFGSLLGAVRSGEGRDSGQYPACFFEDDDDEVVPLRRKLNWGRSVSLQSQGQRKVLGEDMGRKRASSWKKVLLCGCAG